jgi:(4S)-4-hydroxy-5-phosphonooxypentane-2,3-dione isomerase
MYVLIVSARVKPEQRGRFLEAIEESAVTSVRDEPGCLRSDVVRDSDDPDHYLFYEVYRDEEAFRAHRDSDHFARWREAADTVLSAPLEATHAAGVVSRSRWWPWPPPPGPGRWRWGGRRRCSRPAGTA